MGGMTEKLPHGYRMVCDCCGARGPRKQVWADARTAVRQRGWRLGSEALCGECLENPLALARLVEREAAAA